MGTSLAAEPLLALAVTVTAEQRVEPVLQSIVRGLASQPGVALARIWLLPSADLAGSRHTGPDSQDCLCLVASAGTPINSPGEDWCFLQGHFARMPFNVGKVGQVAATRNPILVKDIAAQNDWVVRPEWAKREGIRSFAGHPLVFRDKLLGVIGVFSREPLGPQEFTWLGLFANQAAVAIANARAEEALQSSERNLAGIINTIPTTAWTARPDGYCDFLNQVWLDYAGLTAEGAQGWGWAEAIHPDDRRTLVEEWHSCLASGTPVDTEARIRRSDGSYRWFLIRANPLRDESGKILKWYGTCVDIDDRKTAEDALQSSERNLNLMIDAIPGMIHTARPDGYLDYFNRRWQEYVGSPLSDIEGWKWTNRIHPDDLQAIVDKWRTCLASGEIFEHEARVLRGDGQYRWMFHRKVPLRNEHGNIVRWYGTSLDIEDRKHAEGRLRQSEAELRTITDAIRQPIVVLAPDGETLYVNQVFLDFTGLPVGEVKGNSFFQRVFHPEDTERVREARRVRLAEGVPFDLEVRVLFKSGQYRWQLVQYEPLKDDRGCIIRWYVTATDIDDRKRAEEQLQQLVEQLRRSKAFLAEGQNLARMGNFSWIVATDEIKWSEQLYRIFEFEPGVPISFERIGSRIHPDDLHLMLDMIGKAQQAVSDHEYEYRLLMPDGSIKHLHLIAHANRDHQGRLEYLGAVRDITESKVAEAALDKARSELAHVGRVTTLNALTASIAHEINQPLASLITNASTCLRRLNADPPNVEGARETAQRTIRDGNRASDVITRLRALFSKKEFARETLDLNEVTREVIALSLNDLQRNQVVLRFELAEELAPVIGDRVQLQQVILNLLRNASDAMASVEDRPRYLLIRTQRDQDDGVRLSVQDAGCGLNRQDSERLFEAFYTTKSGGMGIGLSISRSIIERHQGRLWAEPNNGPGTTFSFSIPCDPERAKDAAA